MIDLRKICKKLLFPPIWVLILLALVSGVLLATVFLKGWDTSPIAYAVYVLAFYSLSVLCIFFATVFPRKFKNAKQKVYETKYGNKYMTDAVFRTRVSLYLSFGINLLYIAINLISGYIYHTRWFYILSAYYGILAVMRFLLLRYVGKNQIGLGTVGEWRRARACAYILTLINFALSGAVLMMMYQNRGFTYHGMLIYVMAAYTFYTTTLAIVNIIKYRKYHSPVMTMAKVITLAAALVSMLSLETAMLTAFGTDTSLETKRILIAATGAGICVTVMTMSIYMIVRSAKEIKKSSMENSK